MIFAVAVFLGVVMMTFLLGLVVIPKFDRPLAVSPAAPVSNSALRSAR